MGQYFKAVNVDKQEYVCPWCLGGGAKLWEWAANPQGAIFTLLLRKSSAGGGGDYYGYAPQNVALDATDSTNTHQSLEDALRTIAGIEGQPVSPPEDTIVGRWAGDRVMLVGDYDSSGLWNQLASFRNVSEQLVAAWNAFIELKEMKLTHKPCSGCTADKP